jgi:hypothetical protein
MTEKYISLAVLDAGKECLSRQCQKMVIIFVGYPLKYTNGFNLKMHDQKKLFERG